MAESITKAVKRPQRLKWKLPPKLDHEPEYTNAEDGAPNINVWWALMQQTAKNATPNGSIPQFRGMPPDIARALGAVWGLMQALKAARRSVPREEWQPLGLHDADDLLGAIVQGREHPALRYWQSLPGPKMTSRASELECRTKIIAATRALSRKRDLERGKALGMTRARDLVASALQQVPTFESIKGKTIENWEASQMSKVFAGGRAGHRKARSFVEAP